MKLIQGHLEHKKRKGYFLFLDMEKAFDRVSWKLILGGMEKLGFGEEMISLVRMLYDLNEHPSER